MESTPLRNATDHIGCVITDVEALTRLHGVRNRCLRAGGDFDSCLGAILDAAIYLTGANKGTLELLAAETGISTIRAQRGFHQPFLDFFSHGAGEAAAVCCTTLGAGQPLVVEDVSTDDLFAGQKAGDVLLAEGVRALQSTPLMSNSRRVFGIISVHFARPTRLGEREQHLIELLAGQAGDYVERLQTERLLARETNQFDTMIIECSRDFRYLFANRQCADFLGKPLELILGHSIPEVIGEAAFAVIRPYIKRVLAGERVEYEIEIPYADAGLRNMHVVYVPGFDLQGPVCGWIALINDMTERRNVSAERASSEHWLIQRAGQRPCRAC